MRVFGEGSDEVADSMSAHGGAAGRDRDREDLGRFVSPRLRQILAAADTAARDELLATGSEAWGPDGPERLEAVLTELLEGLPGSFYPVYNSDQQRWELGIR